MTANGRHIGGPTSGRRGTPAEWVDMARVALGGRIELDPMSEPAFNAIVRADRIYTAEDDCFRQDWSSSTMFLNPHGGLVAQAWRTLAEMYSIGTVTAAIWIGFSVEQLNLLADEEFHPDDFSKLTVRARISFTTTEPLRSVVGYAGTELVLECGHNAKPKGKPAKSVRCGQCQCEPEEIDSPTHSNYVVGLGIDRGLFEHAFAGRGRFHHGRYAISAADSFGGYG